MAASKNKNRYRLAQVKQQMADKVGVDPDNPTYEVEIADGSSYTLPHPLFYSSALKAELKPIDDDDADGIAQILLGDQYDAFIEHGGDPEDLGFVQMQVQKDTQDTLAGRKRPTRS